MITKAKLKSILREHSNWLRGVPESIRADLSNEDLRKLDLRGANLYGANLQGANLRGAKIDGSVWPLSPSSFDVEIDKRIASQLLFHALRAMRLCGNDPEVKAVLKSKANLNLANLFHRINECGIIKSMR